MDRVQNIVDRITSNFKPTSIFLYGSRARADSKESSDYEIGVLYPKECKISRAELRQLNLGKDVSVYPFEYESFVEGKLDTPFIESIYMHELLKTARTLWGRQVVETIVPPSVYVIDVLERIRFDTGMALASTFSFRSGDLNTCKSEFTKSCLFGVRCLEILINGVFLFSYEDIYKESLKLDDLETEYANTIKHALDVRNGSEIEEIFIYKNISLLNYIKDKILTVFEEKGNAKLV